MTVLFLMALMTAVVADASGSLSLTGDVVARLFRDLVSFTSGAEQSDDITVLYLARGGV